MKHYSEIVVGSVDILGISKILETKDGVKIVNRILKNAWKNSQIFIGPHRLVFIV